MTDTTSTTTAPDPTVTSTAPEVKLPTNKAFVEFTTLAAELASADLASQLAGNDKKEIDAQKATLATDALKAAIRSKADADAVRAVLADAGVLKGTISKIVTVVNAVAAGTIASGDFKSLYEGYKKVSTAARLDTITAKNIKRAAEGKPLLPVPGTSKENPPAPIIREVEKVVMPAPKDALKVILDDIKGAGDEDMILDRAAFWVSQLTTQITEITSKITSGANIED